MEFALASGEGEGDRSLLGDLLLLPFPEADVSRLRPLDELGCRGTPRPVVRPGKSSPNLDVALDRPGELSSANDTLVLLLLSCL